MNNLAPLTSAPASDTAWRSRFFAFDGGLCVFDTAPFLRLSRANWARETAMAKRKHKRRKTAFVPRVVFATALVGAGVVPACVAACGGRTQSREVADEGAEGVANNAFGVGSSSFGGVAAMGYDVASSAFGVGSSGFGGGVSSSGFGGVAIDAFVAPDAGDATVGDAPFARPDGMADQASGYGDVADVSIED
jgi:hypothetical protein